MNLEGTVLNEVTQPSITDKWHIVPLYEAPEVFGFTEREKTWWFVGPEGKEWGVTMNLFQGVSLGLDLPVGD